MNEVTQLSDNEKVELLSGDTYILFNDLRGNIVIWVNCDPEMSVSIDSHDFKMNIYKLFPQLNAPEVLKQLSQGSYIFTDKMIIKPLKPQNFENLSLTPTLNDVVSYMQKQKAQNRLR